jgi:hypothetical protein
MIAPMQLPPAYDHVILDEKGNTKVVRYQCGPRMEPDPKNPGRARLQQLDRGSALRFGLSYVALGFQANPVAILAAAASGQLAFAIVEPGYLGEFIIQGAPATATVWVTDLSRGGDRMFSGLVPAGIFDPVSRVHPMFGHYVDTTTRLEFNIQNIGAGPVSLGVAFTLI